jgi:hypothetical protein
MSYKIYYSFLHKNTHPNLAVKYEIYRQEVSGSESGDYNLIDTISADVQGDPVAVSGFDQVNYCNVRYNYKAIVYDDVRSLESIDAITEGLMFPCPSVTPTITPSSTITPTTTPSSSPPAAPAPDPIPLVFPSQSVTPTISITPTVTPTITNTPTVTPTITNTPTVTPTVTNTPSITITPTSTLSSNLYVPPALQINVSSISFSPFLPIRFHTRFSLVTYNSVTNPDGSLSRIATTEDYNTTYTHFANDQFNSSNGYYIKWVNNNWTLFSDLSSTPILDIAGNYTSFQNPYFLATTHDLNDTNDYLGAYSWSHGAQAFVKDSLLPSPWSQSAAYIKLYNNKWHLYDSFSHNPITYLTINDTLTNLNSSTTIQILS